MHQEVTERIRIIRRLDFSDAGRFSATYDEHAQVLRSILRRKGDQACLLLRSPIESSKRAVRKITLHRLFMARAEGGPRDPMPESTRAVPAPVARGPAPSARGPAPPTRGPAPPTRGPAPSARGPAPSARGPALLAGAPKPRTAPKAAGRSGSCGTSAVAGAARAAGLTV